MLRGWAYPNTIFYSVIQYTDYTKFKDTGTKACLRERIMGERILMKGCATSMIIHLIHYSYFSVHDRATSTVQQSRFLLLIGYKIIQHNKRSVGFKFGSRVFKANALFS